MVEVDGVELCKQDRMVLSPTKGMAAALFHFRVETRETFYVRTRCALRCFFPRGPSGRGLSLVSVAAPPYLGMLVKPLPGTLAEGAAPFRSTQWGVVLQSLESQADDGTASPREALGQLCEAYWPPLYSFVRRRGYPSADAQDLV